MFKKEFELADGLGTKYFSLTFSTVLTSKADHSQKAAKVMDRIVKLIDRYKFFALKYAPRYLAKSSTVAQPTVDSK